MSIMFASFIILLQLIVVVYTLEPVDYECDVSSSLSITMKRGLWQCAKDLVKTNSDKAIDMKKEFDVEERNIMKEIASLKQLIDTFQPANYINPAFQWAQSPTEILLNVKFAHKLDAPATLNVEANTVNITNNSLLLLASNGRKNFKLELVLLKGIIPSESTYAMASVGRMTITLKKEHQLRWSRLTEGTAKLKHMHVWWDVNEKYKTEVDKLPEIFKPPPPPEPIDSTEPLVEDTKTENDNNGNSNTAESTSNENNSTNNTTSSALKETPKAPPEKTNEEIANEKYEVAIEKLDTQLKSQVKQLEEEIRKRKKEIDLKGREEKTKLDTELAERKKLIISSIQDQKQNINTDSSSDSVSNSDSSDLRSVSGVSSEL